MLNLLTKSLFVFLIFGFFTFQISAKTPVLVELFTAQGCPSCPAADKILHDLETTQPIAGAEIIALAWHVSYWDSFTWKDEFALPAFGQRQSAYARAFNIGETYTPQMIVDGRVYFVGTKLDKATKEITTSAKISKPEISVSLEKDKAKISIPNLPKHERSTVYMVLTQDDLTRKMERGNNAGKTLVHSAIARDLRAVASIEPQTMKFESETVLQLQPEWKKENLNLIVFVQENGSRNILAVSKTKIK